jgi:DNA-binding transcriptional LysR family regulator
MHSAVLLYLDYVGRFGSIRKAAEALNVASSGVNRAVLQLETELGLKLFDRHQGGVTPTPAGERLLQHARTTLSEYQRVQAEVASLAGQVAGEVRIISLPSLVNSFLPKVMAEVAAAHPMINFRIASANPTEILAQMQAARFDIGLMLVDKPHRDIEIVAKVAAPVGAIMRSDHPLARRKLLTIGDCTGFPLVLLDDMWILGPTLAFERGLGGVALNPKVLTNSFELNSALIRSGYGIGFFTAINFQVEIDAGELVHIPLADGPFSRSAVGIVVPPLTRASPPVRVVLDLLQAWLPRLAALPNSQDIRG